MVRDKETAKHIAQSLRIVGVSQFAHYGFQALKGNDMDNIVLAGAVFIALEVLGAFTIYKGGQK